MYGHSGQEPDMMNQKARLPKTQLLQKAARANLYLLAYFDPLTTQGFRIKLCGMAWAAYKNRPNAKPVPLHMVRPFQKTVNTLEVNNTCKTTFGLASNGFPQEGYHSLCMLILRSSFGMYRVPCPSWDIWF